MPLSSNAAGDIAAGKLKAAPCAVCHGAEGISGADIWPFRYTTSFELRNGMQPVSMDDPDSNQHDRNKHKLGDNLGTRLNFMA